MHSGKIPHASARSTNFAPWVNFSRHSPHGSIG
jgi:hypothetical protein